MTIPFTTDLTTLHRAPENWKPPSSQAEFEALAAEAEQDLLRVAFPVDVTGFDPAVQNDLYSVYINRVVFEPLYSFLRKP